MIAIDGPFEGKEYRGVPDETKTLIDHYRTFEEFFEVTYKRTDDGWKHVSTKPMFSELIDVETDMTMINVLDKGYVRLIDVMGNDLEVANAARVSYDKRSDTMTEKDEKLIDFLWREEHTSPFRHCVLSFEIYAPLMVARQHWKYAVGSTFVDDQNGWNESSRRYITEDPEFYVPSKWRSAPENSKQGSGENLSAGISQGLTALLAEHTYKSEILYNKAIRDGVAPEQARLFLPAYGMYVRYRWTTSLHGVMHFLQQRLAHDSQVEIQEYAKAIKDLSYKMFPKSIKLVTQKMSDL